jgi:DNA-binding NarL/FixJ family response regulator
MPPEKMARLERMAEAVGLPHIGTDVPSEMLGRPLRWGFLDASLENRQLIVMSSFLWPGWELVSLAGDVETLVDQLAEPDLPQPDVVVADPTGLCSQCVVSCQGDGESCPLLSRRELIAQLPPVILYVRKGDLNLACRAMAAGVKGFQLHNRGLLGLRDAVLAVIRGGIWIDPDLSAELTKLLSSRTVGSVLMRDVGEAEPLLSEREKEVLREMERGAMVAEVARSLVLSENTIKTHLRRIYDKLDVDNRHDAVMRARLTGQLV